MQLLKHKTVMTQGTRMSRTVHFYNLDSDEPRKEYESLYLRNELFDEFGQPDKITITIEAGDQLN